MVDAGGQQQHPEAELLAAFAERTLTPFEREQMLQHLGECARCREMLFLVHEVTPEAEAVVVVHGRGRVFGWLPVWLPIAAAVVVVLGVGYARMHRGEGGVSREGQPATGTEMALEAPPPQPMVEAPAPADQAASAREFKVAPAPPPPPPPPAALAPPPPPREFSLSEGSVRASRLRQEPQQAGAGVVTQSQQGDDMRRWAVRQDAIAGGVARSAQAVPAPVDSGTITPLPFLARQSQAPAAAPLPPPIAMSATRSTVVTQEMSAAAGATVDSAVVTSLPVVLPGGKAMVSSVAVAGRSLALDAAGKLYVSVDGGAGWREIRQQWEGKATALSLADASAKGSGGAVMLENQDHATWRSDDGGETWQAIPQTKRP